MHAIHLEQGELALRQRAHVSCMYIHVACMWHACHLEQGELALGQAAGLEVGPGQVEKEVCAVEVVELAQAVLVLGRGGGEGVVNL